MLPKAFFFAQELLKKKEWTILLHLVLEYYTYTYAVFDNKYKSKWKFDRKKYLTFLQTDKWNKIKWFLTITIVIMVGLLLIALTIKWIFLNCLTQWTMKSNAISNQTIEKKWRKKREKKLNLWCRVNIKNENIHFSLLNILNHKCHAIYSIWH